MIVLSKIVLRFPIFVRVISKNQGLYNIIYIFIFQTSHLWQSHPKLTHPWVPHQLRRPRLLQEPTAMHAGHGIDQEASPGRRARLIKLENWLGMWLNLTLNPPKHFLFRNVCSWCLYHHKNQDCPTLFGLYHGIAEIADQPVTKEMIC